MPRETKGASVRLGGRHAALLAAVALACVGLAGAGPAFGGWQTFNTGNGLAGNDAVAIFEDRSGNLWFGTKGYGLSRYDGATWRTFTTADGLASNYAFDFLEDRSGNLWVSSFSSYGGDPAVGQGIAGPVSRYDGTNWRTFTTADGLVDDRVTAMLVDREGNLWFGTRNGVSRYDGKTWRTFTTADGLAAGTVLAMLEDHAGNLWFGTYGFSVQAGLSRYDGANWRTFTTADGLTFNSVILLFEDRAGNLWCQTELSAGVSRYDGTTWRTFTTADGLAPGKATAILEDRAGILWFGMSGAPGGVTRYDGATWQTVYRSQMVFHAASLLEDRWGNLWVGGHGIGAMRYDGTIWRTFIEPDPRYQVDPVVAAMLQDRSGNLWFATINDGVRRFDSSTWQTFTDPELVPSATSILETRAGAIWVGGSFGASRYDGTAWQRFTAADGLAGGNVLSMLEDRSGNLWFATYQHGVSRFDGTSWRTFSVADGLADSTFFSMLEDRSGNLWFPTTNGVSRFDGTTWRTFTVPAETGVLEDRAGNVWVWAYGNGASRYDGAAWRPFTTADGLVSDLVITMFEDHAGNLWFGTAEGLSRYDGATWRTFTTADGLRDNNVRHILEDRAGNLWVSDYFGLSRYDGATWQTFPGLAQPFADPLVDRAGNVWIGTRDGVGRYDGSTWVTFTTADGLGSLVFDFLEDHAGNLWFASDEKVARYEPDRVPPRTVFLTRPAELSPSRNQNALFTAAFGEARIEFSYRFDSGGWSAWSSANSWIGNDLADGGHVLEVRSRDFVKNLEQSPLAARFEIDATPPAPLIVSPTFGQPVRGRVEIRGAASDARFKSYTIEMRPAGATSWSQLAQSSTPIASGVLATWDTSSLPDGNYDLFLSVVETLGLVGTYPVGVIVDNHAPFADVTAPATVSAAGGGDLYTTHSELHLYFPPHAFDQDARVTIAADPAPDALPSGASRVQPGYAIEWGAAALKKGATLEFSTAGRATAPGSLAIYGSSDGSNWRRLGGTSEAGKVSLVVRAPGRYALYAETAVTEGAATLSELSFTPRVFSPRGTFANDHLAIGFTLGRSSSVTVRVYNRAGRLVQEVVAGQAFGVGANVVRWNGRDREGQPVPDGPYVVTVEAMGQTRRSPLAVVR